MPLPAGAHVKIGDKHYRLDESQDVPYRRFSRSIFADVPLVGSIGQNLQPGRLVWNQTNFDGEGQVVLDASSAASARRFYRSTGLDFKTAGQFQLNRASTLTLPTPSGVTATTVEGNAGMSDVTGTSTAPPDTSAATPWALQVSGTSVALRDVAYSTAKGMYVAVGASGLILSSTDGSTWVARNSGVTDDLNGVAYSPSLGLWVAVGVNERTLRSLDAITWTSSRYSSGGATFGDVVWSVTEAQFVVASSSSTNATVYSTDGVTFTNSTVATPFLKLARSDDNDLWLALPTSGTAGGRSVDGRSWTSWTTPVSGLQDIYYAGSLWIAVGSSGRIYTSTDGTTWTQRTSNTTATLYGVGYDGSTWVVVGSSGTIRTSTDGTTWATQSSGTSSTLWAPAYSSTIGTWVVVGSSGVVIRTAFPVSVATDRQLNAIAGVIKTTTNHAPGAYAVTVDLYAYRSTLVNVADGGNPVVTFTIYNATGDTVVTTSTATLSSTNSSVVASIAFTAAASTNYSYRVTWASGTGFKPIVDKVIYSVPASAAVYAHEALELGQGGIPWVASSSSTANTNTTTYTYDFSNDSWTSRVTPTTTAGKKPLAMAHTDKYQYVLLDNSIVYQATTSAVSAYIAATTATARGIAITQNRLFVLGEDATNGVVMYLYGIDQTSLPVTATSTVTVDNGKNTPDATLRQRITSSPNGALFFVNYSTKGVIYECDASGASPVVSILAELPEGVKATAILHTGGLTFVAGQFLAPAGKTPRSAMFMIDQNRVIQRVGWFRRDDPDPRPIIAMQAYQNDLWMLQGGLVWRYSLTTGGLFLEHEFSVSSPATARGIAVMQDYVFATYDVGVYVVGKSATYLASQSASLTSSVYDFGLPYEEKLLRSIEVTTYQLPPGSAVKVEYQIDQNGVWVTAGTSYSGTLHYFRVSDALSATRFYTLQVRTTPQSSSGTVTPVVKGVTVQAYTTTSEELFELALLAMDQDSATTLAGDDLSGHELAAYVWNLAQQGALVTFQDGYSVGPYDEPRTFLCKVEAVDHGNVTTGEGTVRVRLRVVT